MAWNCESIFETWFVCIIDLFKLIALFIELVKLFFVFGLFDKMLMQGLEFKHLSINEGSLKWRWGNTWFFSEEAWLEFNSLFSEFSAL